ADPAVGAFGGLVGRDGVRLVLVVADVVGAGDQAGGPERVEQRTERTDAVGTDAREHLRAQPKDATVLARRGAELDALIARMAGRLHVLRARLDPFQGRMGAP